MFWENNDDKKVGKRKNQDDNHSILSNVSMETKDYRVAAKETMEVQRSKVLVCFVLVIAITGAISVYIHNNRMETSAFKRNFEANAYKLLESIGSSFDRALGSLDSLANSIHTIAEKTNQTFPFVTIPEYGTHFAKTMPFTSSIETALLPVVDFNQRREWEEYTARNNTSMLAWLSNGQTIQDTWDKFFGPMPQNYPWNASDTIYGDFGTIAYNESREGRPDVYLPEWHRFPVVPRLYPPANFDWMSIQNPEALIRVLNKKKVTISQPMMIPTPDNPKATVEANAWCEYYKDFIPPEENCMEPTSQWFYPLVDKYVALDASKDKNYPDGYTVKAIIMTTFYWRNILRELLPERTNGLILVVKNECFGRAFTYQIDGPKAIYMGVGDMHDREYEDMRTSSSMIALGKFRKEQKSTYSGFPLDTDSCLFDFDVYPSDQMKNDYRTNNSIVFALIAMLYAVLPFSMFIVYDRAITRRQQEILITATRSKEIVSSLYPSHVVDILLPATHKARGALEMREAIADLYPETTVLFADVVSFTAWSSVRDPQQVFTLLESIYGAFDKAAERLDIFKVECIGDCYLCVSGLPVANPRHAVSMAKFAVDMIREMKVVTIELEKLLGPGTGSLSLRIGMNSGPTTAGVMRGTRGRFQLFGDTVNTAARMESNSSPGKILCSQKTADLLIDAGKESWLIPRSEAVNAKGKGLMQCYWIELPSSKDISMPHDIGTKVVVDNSCPIHYNGTCTMIGTDPQVTWISDMFCSILEEVGKHRIHLGKNPTFHANGKCITSLTSESENFLSPWQEVSNVLPLPRKKTQSQKVKCTSTPTVTNEIKMQMEKYVALIASKYRCNAFHNFDHASHVVMSTRKILSRVIKSGSIAGIAHGMTVDPLVHFAILFSALIHDVDHPGVSNAQLIKEKDPLAIMYDNKSVAEQNSVSMAWDILMQKEYNSLRNALMPGITERQLFRKLLVNCVLATDLFDPDLKNLREVRWLTSFDNCSITEDFLRDTDDDSDNRRSTIVIEHILQASDVSHTMQHWHVYKDWNFRLLKEMYHAYTNGRSEKNPIDSWYDGELWFFDNYVIPLARKLKTCGVFGVSCDELLNYAQDNRREWEMKGREIVAQYSIDLKASMLQLENHGSQRHYFSPTNTCNTDVDQSEANITL